MIDSPRRSISHDPESNIRHRRLGLHGTKRVGQSPELARHAIAAASALEPAPRSDHPLGDVAAELAHALRTVTAGILIRAHQRSALALHAVAAARAELGAPRIG